MPGLDTRDIQQIVDQNVQALGVVLDDLEEMVLFLIKRAGCAHHQDIHIALDGGHGGAQLMTNGGHKLGLQAIDLNLVRDVAENGDRAKEIVLENNWCQVNQRNATVLQLELLGIEIPGPVQARFLGPLADRINPGARGAPEDTAK